MATRKTLLLTVALTFSCCLVADEMSFPEIQDPGIPGTPKLGQPFLVTGDMQPVLTEKHGLAAPALWDWNGDGKRDLLDPVRMNQDYWDETIGKLHEEGKSHWLTMRHQGRVYVMLGAKRAE